MSENYTIEVLNWQSSARMQLRAIREAVFIVEQHVPKDLEWAESDATAQHLLVLNNKTKAIACARILFKQNKIGRMAVLKEYRRQGVGCLLLNKALDLCRTHGLKHVLISAQKEAIIFYEKSGFRVIGKPYLEANILHADMECKFA